MDLRSLRYFVETVRLNSFTQAAESLNVTQSTISKMVRQLEQEVGTELLLRSGRQLELTETGRVVFDRGQEMLAAMRQLTVEVADLQTAQSGHLSIGIPPMINLLFTPVLKAFRKRHPGITLTLREDAGQALERQVASGELEIGMTVLPADPQLGLQSKPITSFPIWALAARGTFPKQHSTLKLKALKTLPLVMLSDDFALTRALQQAFAQAGIAPEIVARSSQWDWLVSMASAGMGVALLPEPFIHRLAIGHLDRLQLVEPELHWQAAHVWRGPYLSHAARAWLEVCDEVLGSASQPAMSAVKR